MNIVTWVFVVFQFAFGFCADRYENESCDSKQIIPTNGDHIAIALSLKKLQYDVFSSLYLAALMCICLVNKCICAPLEV